VSWHEKKTMSTFKYAIVGKINQLLEIFQGTVQQKLQSTRYNDTVQAWMIYQKHSKFSQLNKTV
jgi:hypothetical protein